MRSQIVTYQVDDPTAVRFEVGQPPGFRPAGAEEIVGWRRQAVGRAVEAQTVLDRVKEARPNQAGLRSCIKLSGGKNWLAVQSVAGTTFEISLTWLRGGQVRTRGRNDG